jgi:hypothetical protein
MLTSALCLALLLGAFVISRETLYIHGKCIACQSFSLMVGFLGKAFNGIFEFHLDTFMCYGLGKFYILLSTLMK